MGYSNKEYRQAAQACLNDDEASVALEYFVKPGLVSLEGLEFPDESLRSYFYSAMDREAPRAEVRTIRETLPEGYRPIGAAHPRAFVASALATLALGLGGGAYLGAEGVGASNQHYANRNHWAKVHSDETCLRVADRYSRLAAKLTGGYTVELSFLTDKQKQACGLYYDNYEGRWDGHILDGQDPGAAPDQTAKLPSTEALQKDIQKETVKAKDYSITEPIMSGIAFSFLGLITLGGGFGFSVNMLEKRRKQKTLAANRQSAQAATAST